MALLFCQAKKKAKGFIDRAGILEDLCYVFVQQYQIGACDIGIVVLAPGCAREIIFNLKGSHGHSLGAA